MKKEIIILEDKIIKGISAKTNNGNEMTPQGKIPGLWQKYFNEKFHEKIPEQKDRDLVYGIYQHDNGNNINMNVADLSYTFVIGNEVGNSDKENSDLYSLKIPGQKYVKFTTEKGKMPDVCINAWSDIWSMSEEQLGGKRSFETDFEIWKISEYSDDNCCLEIFIGIE